MVRQDAPGYGAALRAGFAAATGAWVLTIDADTAAAPAIAVALWTRRHDADVVIGSRYVAGGEARMPPVRRLLSRVLNLVFGRGLSLGVRDLSSGMRIYRAPAVRALRELPPHLDVLQAILVAGLRRGLERRRDAGAVRARCQAVDRTRAPGGSPPTTPAPSGGCGSSATRSSAPTTTPGPTTA